MAEKLVKVAVLVTVVEYGGAEKVVLLLIGNISNDLYELVPIVFTRFSQTANNFFKHLDKMKTKYHKIFLNNYKFKYINFIVNIVEAYKLLKKEKIDLIHTHGYRADVIGIFLSKLIGLPIISTCHGFISNDTNLKVYNRLDRFLLRFFNEIIAVSEEIKDELIRSGIKESRIEVILNAIPTKVDDIISNQNRQKIRGLFGIKEEEFVVGYVGRLSQEKGIKHLIEATSVLIESGIPVKVLIIGDGPQRKELKALANEQEAKQEIIFSGFQENIENWFPAMDVFVLPSLTEGTPMALLEAMAFGLPVVASAVGGVPRIIESGKNGILVSGGNSVELKDAIEKLCENKSLREKISKEAWMTVNVKYDVKSWVRKIEEEYIKTVGP